MVTRGRARSLNREDTTPSVPYESTPGRNIVKLSTFELIDAHTVRLLFSTQLKNDDGVGDIDTWIWNGITWAIVVVAGLKPTSRKDHSMCGCTRA